MENKKINIDPKFFEFPSENTTKRRKPSSENAIRVRAPPKPKDHNKTTKRNALLKFIRRHQANNYQQILDGKPGSSELDIITHLPKNEIDETLEYLMGVADEVRKKEVVRQPQYGGQPPGHYGSPHSLANYTLKRPSAPTSHEHVSMNFPDHPIPSNQVLPSNIQLTPRHPVGNQNPSYGCLRGGNLPTYRTSQVASMAARPRPYASTTLPDQFNREYHGQRDGSLQQLNAKVTPLPDQFDREYHGTSRIPYNQYGNGQGAQSPHNFSGTTNELPERSNYIFGSGGKVKHSDEYTKSQEKIDPSKLQLKIVRQRRTVRRTFKIGKSKTRPKVGVLISNRTLRKNIATNALLLKQTPMTEIRRYLVKHNLITVGSNAPDYVLRKMYETTNTVCGEIFNHNNENLLHNFFHGKDE